jgi:hypothetical protein
LNASRPSEGFSRVADFSKWKGRYHRQLNHVQDCRLRNFPQPPEVEKQRALRQVAAVIGATYIVIFGILP